jgi:hypothetical protein
MFSNISGWGLVFLSFDIQPSLSVLAVFGEMHGIDGAYFETNGNLS